MFGLQSHYLTADMMGEDLMFGQDLSSGWFRREYNYNTKGTYNNANHRSYNTWRYYYDVIASVNPLISAEETMAGFDADKNYIIGQAYALRALSYFYLTQFYCRTYKGHENDPGVPIYDALTTEGAGRGTLEKTYTQIMSDIDKAIKLLADAPAQKNPAHIDYRVANGLKARFCLFTEDWDGVLTAAREAQKTVEGGKALAVGTAGDLTTGFSDVTKGNVMWGIKILAEHTSIYNCFVAHLDNRAYYSVPTRSPKAINRLLYDKMGENDVRRNNWWKRHEVTRNAGKENEWKRWWWQQFKFTFTPGTTNMADRIVMRVEEMVLMEAEALCQRVEPCDGPPLHIV